VLHAPERADRSISIIPSTPRLRIPERSASSSPTARRSAGAIENGGRDEDDDDAVVEVHAVAAAAAVRGLDHRTR